MWEVHSVYNKGRIGLAAVSAAVLVMAATGALHAGEIVEIDGMVHVKNGAEPSQGAETIRLEELWRAGGEDDDIFFGYVTKVMGDDEGNVYVMDQQLAEVHVYSPDGEHLKTLGREGEGPGETRNPADMFLTPKGDLAMVQQFPGSIVLVDLDGNPAGKLTLGTGDPSQGQFSVLVRGMSGGGNIVLGGIRMTFEQGRSNQTYFLSVCDEEAKELQRCLSKEHTIDYANFVLDEGAMDFAWGRADVGPDGRVYVAPERNEYEIHVLSKEGTLEKIIEREYESWKREPSQREATRRVIDAVGRYYPQPPREVTIEDLSPDIVSITVAEDGRIWVRPSRGDFNSPDGVLTTVDVFDADGHFVKQFALAAPGNAENDAIYMVGRDRLVVVTGALDAFTTMQGVGTEEGQQEASPLEVICYSITGLQAKG